MKPTKEQIEVFWKGYGCYQSKTQTGTGWWFYPDKTIEHGLPSIDLNNLVEYAVKEDWDIHFYFDNCSQTQDCIITLPNEKEYDGSGDTRKEALFWAIDKVRSV